VEGRSPAPWMISRRRCGDGGVHAFHEQPLEKCVSTTEN